MKKTGNIIEIIVLGIILTAFSAGIHIFASDICISKILISGNKLTKDFTILRELPFREGDIMSEDILIDRLTVASNHLTNMSLFNYVYVDYLPDTLERDDCQSCVVTIRVEERWYYWPQVSLKLENRNLSSWLREMDFNRITIGWGLRVENVFGLRHKAAVSNYLGYERGLRFSYAGIALDRKRTQMLDFGMTALFNKTLNVRSENNRVVYIKTPDHFLDQSYEGNIRYSYRPGIRTIHAIEAGFGKTQLGDTALVVNSDYWGTDQTVNHTFRLLYEYSYEHRDYIYYPTKGYYLSAVLKGVTADKMRFFYGETNVKLQYYDEIAPRLYWSSRLNAGLSFKNKPAYIYDLRFGYEDKNMAGYDYYVVDGQHHAILNNDLRFLLMPKRIFNLSGRGDKGAKFLKIHFTIYAKLMLDAGYVHDASGKPDNSLANTFLHGYGLGLDLVTYYDIVLNCSYAIDKMGHGGWYFGIKALVF